MKGIRVTESSIVAEEIDRVDSRQRYGGREQPPTRQRRL